ncbi:MFS transporter [Amycolatopsis cynarae]|uniref:MFS transporter n=1 Tax=Amycolatopsis cynarae TaxID=2995223 RepID=A0ABY7AUZ9_9PSEU|nr:MFS transporter [Amycolatopsis sp. HUAS 11-8]WAL63805.1 MFS transporter [Amycolatopsis sp. HUAS 11-8]
MYVTPQPPPAARPWWLVLGPGFAALIGLFLLTVAHPFGGAFAAEVQRDLRLSSQAVLFEVLVTYVLAAALGAVLGLLLGGRVPTGLAVPAICLMLLGTLALTLSPNGLFVGLGRALTGLGAGVTIGVTVALIRTQPRQRGAAFGVFGALGLLALVVAPFLGKLVADVLSWRICQLIALPFLFLALLLSAICGIIAMSSAKRPVPSPMPYAAPYPPQPQYQPQPGYEPPK